MRAVTVRGFGDYHVLALAEVDEPEPGPGELLLDVAYAGVNHVDWQLREGWYRAAEDVTFPYVPGWDVAGTVIGGDTGTAFSRGDRVFAYCRGRRLHGGGAYAQRCTVAASSCARVPAPVPLSVSATVPVALLTAHQVVTEALHLEAGTGVLVLGASGAVGRQVVALALSRGARAHVVDGAVGTGASVDGDVLVHPSLEDVPSGVVDIVVDCVGVSADEAAYRPARRGGRFLSVAGTPDEAMAAAHGVLALHWFSQPDGAALREVAGMVARGELVPAPVVVLPMEQAAVGQQMLHNRATAGHKVSLAVAATTWA